MNRKAVAVAATILVLALLSAWFLSIEHEIDVEIEGKGTADPSSPTVGHLGSVDIAFVPEPGWELGRVLLNGELIEVEDGVLSLTRVTSDHSVRAVFVEKAPETFTIVAGSGPGGEIDPSGTIVVERGGSISFVAKADPGYVFSAFYVNGLKVSGSSTYRFDDVSADHRIEARFAERSHDPEPIPGPSIVSLSVEGAPEFCYANEKLDISAMKVVVRYSDGSSEEVIGYSCAPTSWDSYGNKTVAVGYGGKTATFQVLVPELKGIEVTTAPDRTVFQKREELSLNGMAVTARYAENGYDRVVDGYSISPESFSKVGKQTVAISYSDGVRTVTSTQSVTIVDAGGFEATVVSYSGTKVENGVAKEFTSELSTPLSNFTFDMSNIVPGISQTVEIKVKNGSGIDLNVRLYVSDLSARNALADQIFLSSGDSKSNVSKAANSSFIELGTMAPGASETIQLTMTFVEGEDNNSAMDQRLTFSLGVFANDL